MPRCSTARHRRDHRYGGQGAETPDDPRAESSGQRPDRQNDHLREKPGHADFIQERFENYPRLAGKFARTITFKTEYAQSLVDDFSQKDKCPNLAISVDMLDTGIDVPEVVNLVFFKLVRSKTKFWQMVGGARGSAATCSRRGTTRSSSTSSIIARTWSSSARILRRPMAH